MKISPNYNVISKVRQVQPDNKIGFRTVDNPTSSLPLYNKAYILPFRAKLEYNPKNDLQLIDMKNNYSEANVNYSHHTTESQKKIINDFFTDKNEKLHIKKILGSNGSTYLVSDGDEKVVIKVQHKTQDGRYSQMVTRTNSPDFQNETEKLKNIPENINSTHILADIQFGNNPETARKALVLSFIPGQKLADSRNFLNPNNLEKLYDDLLELDKKQIFHRDLNAFNIMANNQDGNLYVLDYGASKYFSELDELSKKATQLYSEKQQRMSGYHDFLSFADIETDSKEKLLQQKIQDKKADEELINKIKYRRYEDLALSNVENFETLGLLPYLKTYSDNVSKGKIGEISSADKLFLSHLQLKAKYHKKRISILESDTYKAPNKEVQIENEKILAKILSVVDPDNVTPVTKDIANVELLRMKMLNSQKVARLFVTNSEHNYKMAMYWNMDLGVVSRYAIAELKNMISKYSEDKDMLSYIYLNLQVAKFYNQEIFPEVYKSVFGIAMKAITDLSALDSKGVRQTMEDGCWLDSSKRAPSNYVPKSPHKYGMFQF